MKTFRFLLLLSLSMVLFSNEPYAQIFQKRPPRKELISEIARLKKIIDSLQIEINTELIPISDTISDNDSINPGRLGYFDTFQAEDTTLSTDSLLNQWYINKNLASADTIPTDIDSCNFVTDIPDSVFIQRLKAMNSFISLPYNNIVKNHILFYTQNNRAHMDIVLGLSSYYMPQFEEIFDEYDLPKELKVMAIIESGLNPVARSRVSARGMWQFMYRTALQYNLEINSYVDERLDPIKSGKAAARYLKDAYTIFGDWPLAIASFNCGVGNVNKAIKRAGGSRDFWKVYPYLPRETRGYVPSFVAALYTLNYYKEHRITPRPIQMPAHVDTFMIHKPLHFGQISELLGIPKEEIETLNPQYINDIIPASEKGYELKLPYNYTTSFIEKEGEIFTYKDSIYFNPILYAKNISEKSLNESRTLVHKVKRGETLGRIAIKYGVKLSDLQRWNHVRSTIKIGQRLTIYQKGYSPSNSTTSERRVTAASKGGYTIYTVKKGDNLWGISRKFDGVTLNDLLKLNGLTKNSKIVPGTKLKIKES